MSLNNKLNVNYLNKTNLEENQTLIRNNMLIKGVIDKNLIGTTSFGLLHSFYELFGHNKTRMLTTSITRLCINYLKIRGFTCGLEDLRLDSEIEI